MAPKTAKGILDSVSLYFHIPFCKRKCNYCDFTSYRYEDYEKCVESYFYAMENELRIRLESCLLSSKGKIALKSMYLGGGTPSLIQPSFYTRLFSVVSCYFTETDFDKIENTVEVNPDTVTESYLAELSSIGINRVSIGIQSLDDDTLKRMGRVHDTKTALEAANMVRKIFSNYSCDFIVGYDRNPYILLDSLNTFIRRFQPDQLCFYPLEIHPNTPLGKEKNAIRGTIASPDRVSDFVFSIPDFLQPYGFVHYEVSSFAKPGHFSVHNISYWSNDSYLGIGVSAGGHIHNYRYVNASDINEYVDSVAKRSKTCMVYENRNSEEEEFKETLFMALRMKNGIKAEKIDEILPSRFTKIFYDFIRQNPEFVFNGDRIFLTDDCFIHNYTALEKIANFSFN